MPALASARTTATAPAPEEFVTLGEDLYRTRLARRAQRVEQVLAALRDRALYRDRNGAVPAPLRLAIRGFERELAGLRLELAALRAAG